MAGPAFRFVHAADFHLEEAVSGLTEVPDHLRTVLTDAPMRAAEGVVETAIAERAEFLLLSGDLLQPELAGPRAISFLAEQFRRLGERDIAVYWATGRTDAADKWPARVGFPENVHLFSEDRVEELSHFRHEHPIATVFGRSGSGQLRHTSADYQGDTTGPFQVAVGYGEADADALIHRNIDYWALGGIHQHTVLLSGPCRAEYAGSPQGRKTQEDGTHGCIVGQVAEDGQLSTRLVATDAVRWRKIIIAAGDVSTRDELRRVVRHRMQEILSSAGQQPALVSVTIQSDVHTPVHSSGLAEELTGWLREQFGYGSPSAWTVRVDLQPPVSYPEDWYEEDSILGDFLRAVHEQRTKNSSPLDMTRYASAAQANGELSPAMRTANPATRTRLLAEASLLGIDLLHGDTALHKSVDQASRPDKEELSA